MEIPLPEELGSSSIRARVGSSKACSTRSLGLSDNKSRYLRRLRHHLGFRPPTFNRYRESEVAINKSPASSPTTGPRSIPAQVCFTTSSTGRLGWHDTIAYVGGCLIAAPPPPQPGPPIPGVTYRTWVARDFRHPRLRSYPERDTPAE